MCCPILTCAQTCPTCDTASRNPYAGPHATIKDLSQDPAQRVCVLCVDAVAAARLPKLEFEALQLVCPQAAEPYARRSGHDRYLKLQDTVKVQPGYGRKTYDPQDHVKPSDMSSVSHSWGK